MNILHVSATDIKGGADRAAYRIHRSLVNHGMEQGLISQMRVLSKLSDDSTVLCGPPAGYGEIVRRLQERLRNHARRGFRTDNRTLHSTAWPDTGLGQELVRSYRRRELDVVHLHWLGDATLSIEEIGRLPMPLVWTLHDQWAFCGAEHYTSLPALGETVSSEERFALGYTPSNRPRNEAGPDLNRRTWLRKKRCWFKHHHLTSQIVCPSTWLADCARRSALMADLPITVIPYPIDLQRWAPLDQRQARTIYNLPLDCPLLLFGAIGGTTDSRKGADLLFKALQRLRSRLIGSPLASLELVVFGQSQPIDPPDLGFPIHYTGHLSDDISLRLLYSSANAFILPSRQDNLPNTGMEAHACGIPVVAFRTGGLPEIISDRTTGALAEPFDPDSLADAIEWVLVDPQRCRQLGDNARQRAESLWDPSIIAASYAEFYPRLERHSVIPQ